MASPTRRATALTGVTRLLLVASRELSQDIRVRRQAVAALQCGLDVAGLSVVLPGETTTELAGVPVARVGGGGQKRIPVSAAPALRRRGSGPFLRELRGLYRLARAIRTTVRLDRAARRIPHCDIVHANEIDALPAGYLAARRFGARLVYDAHELHAFVEVDPPRLHRVVMSRLERALARRADAVVTNCDSYADFLQQHFRLSHRPIVVLNAPERIEQLPPRPARDGRLRAVYQAGPDQPTRPVSDIVRAAEHAPDVDLTIRVVSFDRAAIQRLIDERELGERVRIAPPVAVTDLVTALTGFDVGIILLRPLTRDSELSQPGKLLEYMMAGLAVVVPKLPGMAPLVEENLLGLTYQHDSPEELGRALQRLADDPDTVTGMQARGRELALERFNFEHEVESLALAWAL